MTLYSKYTGALTFLIFFWSACALDVPGHHRGRGLHEDGLRVARACEGQPAPLHPRDRAFPAVGLRQTDRAEDGNKFSKVLYIVTLYIKYTRPLTFESLCQENMWGITKATISEKFFV